MKIIFLILLLLSNIEASWKSERENLDNVYQINTFRIFYTLHGKNAISDMNDINKNNIPDIIENIALQLDTADKLFHNILGFNPPLLSNRYKDNVKSIDIHILSLDNNGESGDAVIKYNYKIVKENQGSLTITISKDIKAENLTPAHELFHAYQNGYTMFKNRWYTEGTARWSEFAFQKKTGEQRNLPSNADQVEKLLNRTYDAKYFWNRLLFLCAEDDKEFELSKNLASRVYIGTNTKIIEDNTLFGYKFLIDFFKKLDDMDDVATSERHFETYNWKESEQKSFANNLYILKALKNTIIENNCHKNQEVNQFLEALDTYLINRK